LCSSDTARKVGILRLLAATPCILYQVKNTRRSRGSIFFNDFERKGDSKAESDRVYRVLAVSSEPIRRETEIGEACYDGESRTRKVLPASLRVCTEMLAPLSSR
jgi:hypothetical protein